jgi:anthranilate phosphoribosyltransferase
MITTYVRQLMAQDNLPAGFIKAVFEALFDANQAQQAALIMGLSTHPQTRHNVAELVAAMQPYRILVPLPPALNNVVDIVGTGGDGLKTFNISTAASLVVASCGVRVAKHGGRAASSASGSADVAGQLGINFCQDSAQVLAQLQQHNLAFLFAPKFCDQLKYVSDVRKNLGVPTIFNLMGPLLNPTNPQAMVLGVYDAALLAPIATYLQTRVSHALVVHGSHGLDEISVAGLTQIYEVKQGVVENYSIMPQDIGLRVYDVADIVGGDASHNAALISNLFNNPVPSAALDIVAANAGAALYVAGFAQSLTAGVVAAKAAIQNGTTAKFLAQLRQDEADVT